MAYDSSRHVMVLFGGDSSTSSGNAFLNDTWEYDGQDWKQIQTSVSPPARGHGSLLAYDSCRNVTILFGGNEVNTFPVSTWEYDGKIWMEVQVSNSPPG